MFNAKWQQKERKKGVSTSQGHPPPPKKVLHKVGMKKSTCICTISKTFQDSLHRRVCSEYLKTRQWEIKVELNLITTLCGISRGMEGCWNEKKRLNIQDHDNNPWTYFTAISGFFHQTLST